MIVLLALGVILLLVIIFKPSIITEALTSFSTAPELHAYTNSCVTKKPYGFPSHSGMYEYWKDRPKSWATEYSKERVRGNINNVRSYQAPDTILLGSQPSPVDPNTGPHPHYYHNADKFCKENPGKYPCAKGSHVRTHISGDMSKPVPGLLQGHYGHVLDKNINDNYHIRIIEKGREDQGLCGNTNLK